MKNWFLLCNELLKRMWFINILYEFFYLFIKKDLGVGVVYFLGLVCERVFL